MDVVLPAWIGDVGPIAGLLIITIIALLRGWLVPGTTVDRLLAEKQGMIDLQTAAVARWEAAHEVQRQRAETAEAQAAGLLAGLDTQTQLLRSIQQEAARRRRDGG
jgi:hypothetical protein